MRERTAHTSFGCRHRERRLLRHEACRHGILVTAAAGSAGDCRERGGGGGGQRAPRRVRAGEEALERRLRRSATRWSGQQGGGNDGTVSAQGLDGVGRLDSDWLCGLASGSRLVSVRRGPRLLFGIGSSVMKHLSRLLRRS
jgi:hypothetical protein